MVEELGSDILQEPKEIIALISHILEDDKNREKSEPAKSIPSAKNKSFGLEDLKIVDESDDEMVADGVNDEDGAIPELGGDEMVITAVTLLLAVLEGSLISLQSTQSHVKGAEPCDTHSQ